jgi:Lipocalin-like domain
MRTVTTLFILLFITIYLVACSYQPGNNRNKMLAGMYKLYKIESQDSAGAWKESGWYNGGESYIVYDGLGHMAVQITPKGYKDFKWLDEEQAIDEKKVKEKTDSMSLPELKAAVAEFASNYVYVANYTLGDTADVITHKRIIGTIPAVWNSEVKRKFSFSGDTIILKPFAVNRRLIWIRQK